MNRFQRGSPPAPEETKPTHGAGTLLRLYRERDLDLRRSDHRALVEWQKAIVEDLGGQTEIDSFQRTMVDRAVELLIVIRAMSSHVEENGIIQGKELTPCLRSSFLAYNNTFRHTLLAAFEHGGKKPKKSVNLKDYLENLPKEEKENGEKENNSSRDGAGDSSQARRHHREPDGDEGTA